MFNYLNTIYLKCMWGFLGNYQRFPLRFEEEKEILDGFESPMTDIERSFYQYKCQKKVNLHWILGVLLNVFCAIALFPTILYFYIRHFFNGERKGRQEAIFASPLDDELVPQEIMEKINETIVLDRRNGSLNSNDLFFLLNIIIKYPWEMFFCYKCVCLIAVYSYGIYQFQPQMIIATAEFSFASSVLTMYCEKQQICHCNIQHGEKLFFIRDAFSRFSKFYVWDLHYVRLFQELRTGTKNEDFIVCPPVVENISTLTNEDRCTYYLQDHNDDELRKVKKYMEQLKRKYKVRPHPVHIQKKIYEIFDASCIELPHSVSVLESISSSKCAISMDSTALFQAYLLNVPVVIDDVSNPEYFSEVKKRGYIMLDKPHTLLSELLDK